MIERHVFLTLAGLALAACGGASDGAAETDDGAATSGGEAAEAPPEEAPADGVTYAANPLLNMYVQGPDPDPGEALEGAPDDYHASILVTNTGDAPVGVRWAHIQFQVWHQNEMVACEPDDQSVLLEGPSELGPGEAHTYRADLHCEFPGSGEFEVRAFMSFGAESPTFERERHYAGSYTVRVP